MNSTQAKQLSLPELMKRLGHEPTEIKKGGGEYWYHSPFRTEKEASFHTSFLGGKWIWNDFGDIGGTVIDFVMRHEKISRVKDALQFLDTLYPRNSPQLRLINSQNRVGESKSQKSPAPFSSQQPRRQASEADSELEFIKAQPIANPLIHAYLEQKRGIPRHLAGKYLEQVHYRHRRTDKTYFAFGMKNQTGGYEIRIASDDYGFTKSSLGGKDITLILGVEPGKGKINLFEGMIDCLSLMAMYNVTQLKGDSIILNTTKHSTKAIDYIRSQNYDGVNGFLDNDRAGEGCLTEFREVLGDNFIHPQNQLYAEYSDVNEALVANQPKIARQK